MINYVYVSLSKWHIAIFINAYTCALVKLQKVTGQHLSTIAPKNSSHQFSRQFMSMSLITTNETPHVVWTTLTNLDRLSLLMNAVVDIFHASNLNAMLPMGLAYIDIWSDIYDVMNNVVEIDIWWNMVWKGLIIWFVLWIVNQEISSTDT